MSAFVCSSRRLVALVTSASLVALGAVVLLPASASAAPGPGITATKQAPASVLAGQPISFTLSGGNPSSNAGAQPEYNASFRDVLPLGLTYTAGSTTPAGAGEPTVYTNVGTGQQTLVWNDVDDIQVDSSAGLTFSTTVDNTVLPVASVVLNTTSVYASTNPRTLPAFDAAGAPVANAAVQTATSNQTSTTITALKITKDEPSPESKLLRGVHDHPTVYTLTVTNTSKAATNATSVTDYLPAQEEFLGCGQIDNSAGVEYPGAPSLTATPAVGANCPTPASVATVANPPADGSVVYPAGIYTKVVWNLGTLAAGQVVTIKYAAGIPLRANALFAGGPSAASLGQTANLDNNTGPSTRQIGGAAAQINYAHAAGTYTGPVASGGSTSVFDDTTHQVTVNDLRIYKSVSPGNFVAGAVATYTLHVDSGEYTDNSAITITDTLPNGVCPLDDVSNKVTGAPAECNSGAGFAPSLPYQSVTQNADGTFTVVFQPIAVAKDGSTVIIYKGRDRTVYTGGALAGEPIAAGDSFTNNAVEVGTSTPIAATGYTGTQSVTDPTHATQTTSPGTLTKTVSARSASLDCSSASYGKTNPVYRKGDRVCFEITSTFSTENQTRNVVLTDFLPPNTTYEAGSVSYPASNTVDPAQINFDASNASGGTIAWKVGAVTGDGSTQVPVGKVFVARIAAIITETAAGPATDKPGNLIKQRSTNSNGVATSLRDLVNFQNIAAPPIGLTKGVASVNGSATNPANIDHVAVREGDSVVFRVDATNNGSAVNSNNIPITGMNLWDVLPTGISCALVSAISDAGTCTNPGDAGQPSFTGNGTRSAIVWNYGTSLAAAATKTFNYTVAIPAGVSVSADLVNTAAVRSYTVDNDTPGTTTLYPAANVDTSVPAASYDAPAAADNSDVYVRDVAVTKGVASAINETGNTGAEGSPAAGTQATIGEQVTFSVSATVPAHSSVFNASFTDPLPTGLTLNSATGTFRPDAGSATTAALPAGVTFSATAPPTFSFPASYDNTTGTDQVFSMTIVATLAAIAGNVNGVVRTNTASFTSQTAATGGTAIPPRTASATVTDVEPAASLTKTNNAGGPVSGGQTITYTVKPANAAGRPPLHDAWQLDCLPNGLTFSAYGALPGGVTTSSPMAGNGSNGCPAGYTVLAWNLGDLAGGSTLTLTYTATVDPGAAGKSSFVNSASVSGNSLAQARTSPVDPGNPAGRQYSAAATSTVNIAGATALKSVTPASATVGDTVTYSTSAVLPAGVNFYNLSLIDQVPNGIDPNSIVEGAVTCANADTTACSLTSATPLTPVAGSASSTVIGWLVGDAASASQARTVTVKYTAKVKDNAAAVAGAGLVNQLHIAWNTSAGTPPTSAGATFNQSSPTVTATVTVLEPALSILKSVSNTTPEPGQSFNYTVGVNNANTSSTSSAYNLTVTDTVPTGVLVDPASISGGGTISGQATNGGGTISWTLTGPIAKNTGTTFTYSATLAPSGGLTAAGLTNTARITGYDSLPTGGRHYTGGTSTATVTPKFPKVSTAKSLPGGSTAYLGESFPWKLTVTNTGTGVAYQVGAVDTLPANWTYDTGSARVSVNGGAAGPIEPTLASSGGVQTVTWTGLGTLPVGTNLTITYTATPQSGVPSAPGIGLSVNQTNTATGTAQDATGASGNSTGPYSTGPGSATAHIASADVSLAKVVGLAPVAGQSGSFVLTVHNNGPDTATGPFTVTDPFNNPAPAGVSNVVATGTGWTCSGTPIVCVRTAAGDTLANGASFPAITLNYDVNANVGSGTGLTNTAKVVPHTYDPDVTSPTGNNQASATGTVSASADVRISKTVSSPKYIAGAPVSYALAVSNFGPSAAAGPIVVNDDLPAGTTFVSASGTGWTCDPITAGTVAAHLHCTQPGPLTVGATPAAITVTVGVPSGQTAAVSNTATVSSATTDPTPANNSSSVTNIPATQADLQIQKRHLTTTFVAGQTADYQIDVYNAGESDAAGVSVSDPLPAGLSYDSFSSTDPNWACSAAGATVTCSYTGSFPAGQTSSITLTVALASNFTGTAVNTATVSATTTDPVPGNNSSTDNSSTNTVADLSIVKTDSGPATAGTNETYHLAVHNAGPSDVAGPVTVSDSLPAGLSYVSATGTGWVCGYTAGTRLLSCGLAAGLVTGADATTIDVVVTVDADVQPSTIDNTATVGSDTADPVLGNNSSTDPITVSTSAELTLTKTLTSATPVIAGTDATFDLTASNAGPSDATVVRVTDTLPANMSLDSYTGTGWSCVASGQDVICTRASIAAGATAPVITLHVLVSAATPVTLPAGTATLTNTAVLDSDTPGTDHNPAPVDVPVQAQADLSLVKTPKNGTAGAGGTFTWHLAVHNDGPSDATGPITVVDTLPGHQTYASASGGWDCTPGPVPADPADPQTVTCTLATGLAAGADAAVLDLMVQLDAGAPAGVETNSATASSPTPGADGSDSAGVTVTRTAVLSITKSHVGHGVIGDDLAFTIGVHNAGPAVADQVVVADPLPSGLTYVSGAGTGWTCTEAAGAVSCELAGALAVGADAPALTVTATVGVAAYPSVTNEAMVSSTDPDLPGSATASDPVVVDPAAALQLTKVHVGTFTVGSSASYRLTVRNTGLTESPGPVLITDPLPAGLSYRGFAGAGWACAADGSTVTCTRAGAFAAGASSSVRIDVTVTAAAYPSLTNTATVSGPGSAAGNGTDTTPVNPLAVLTIVKKLLRYKDNVATYGIAVTNHGPNPTNTTLVLTDHLPTGLTLGSIVSPPAWTCDRTVVCRRTSSMPAGETDVFVLTAKVLAPAGTTITNVATVTGGSTGAASGTNPVDSAVLEVSASGSGPGGVLAQTGSNTGVALWAGFGLLLLGAAMVLLGRRRRA